MNYFGHLQNSLCNMFCYPMIPNPFMIGTIQGYNSSMFQFAMTHPSIMIPQNNISNCNTGFNIPNRYNIPSYPDFNIGMSQPQQVQLQNNYYVPHYEFWQEQPSPFDFTYGDIFGPPCTTGYSNWDTVFNNFMSGKLNLKNNPEENDVQENNTEITENQNSNHKIDTNKLDSKLGKGFTQKVKQIAKDINCDWEDLLGVMQAESGLNPKTWNGKSAVGLIQFTQIAIDSLNQHYHLNLTKEKIAKMSAIEQLEYVEKHLKLTKSRHLNQDKKLSAGDLYALIFLPGRANREVLTQYGEKYYAPNKGLDLDHNNEISKQDLANQVNKKKLEIMA